MDYVSYLKEDLDKLLFIEISRDIDVNGVKLRSGDYPLLSNDFISITKDGKGDIPVNFLIKGMAYIIAIDNNFKHYKNYVEALSAIKGVQSFLIKKIEENKDEEIKSAIIYATALCRITEKKEYLYNRIVLLMKLYENKPFKYIEDEIISSLKDIIKLYPDFKAPYFHLGIYLKNNDRDAAKYYLKQSSLDSTYKEESSKILREIEGAEAYEEAVEGVKDGRGEEYLKTLIEYAEENPENPNIRYYLSVALRQAGHYNEALSMLKFILEWGDSLEVLSETGLNLAIMGKYKEALSYFEKALKIKKVPEILCNAGVCCLNNDDIKGAREYFNSALKLDKDYIIAREWLEKIEK